jgi:hypothetical protein
MRISDRLLNCVGFISHSREYPQYLGTTFIVGVPGKYGNVYFHAVTAKHVVKWIDGQAFLIGVNFKDGKAGWFQSSMKWWYHPSDQHVDVAVTVFTPTDRFDIEYIPQAVFVTDEMISHYQIGIGDEISVIGLFTRFSGKTRHIPIVRTGNIAMMPTEKLPQNDGDEECEMDVYLAEGRSIGGLSGSPVFVRHTVNMGSLESRDGERQFMAGLGRHHFLGLMRGHWDLPVSEKAQQAEAVNMGISIIVPAKKILEVLYHPELIELREKHDKAFSEGSVPTLDSIDP